MKKLSSIILLFAAMFFSSCAKDSAESVAERFAVAYHNMDFGTAKSLATENSAKQLDLFAQMAESIPSEAKEDARKVIVTMGKGQENGDKASYFYTPSDNPVPQKINLVKVKGEWKVEWNKDKEIEDAKKALNAPAAQPAQPAQADQPGVEVKIGDGTTE
ncbi:MAG: hypothetical protein BGO31_13555 [Bacteroidetes bacterium 43-16]|nr:MAG: hypothetical protein BGO31_13555 [Bacteroidetes bacterium 43-16]